MAAVGHLGPSPAWGGAAVRRRCRTAALGCAALSETDGGLRDGERPGRPPDRCPQWRKLRWSFAPRPEVRLEASVWDGPLLSNICARYGLILGCASASDVSAMAFGAQARPRGSVGPEKVATVKKLRRLARHATLTVSLDECPSQHGSRIRMWVPQRSRIRCAARIHAQSGLFRRGELEQASSFGEAACSCETFQRLPEKLLRQRSRGSAW